MCFAPQRRAIFGHRKLEKCPVPVSFFIFWLENMLRATAPFHFAGSELPKLPWDSGVLCILTWKWASRHSGVPFWNMWTSKIALVHFDLKMGFAPQWRTIFGHVNFENCSAIVVFCAFWLENVLRATAACHFSFFSGTATSAPAALARLLFEHQEPRIIEKTQRFAASLTFGARGASFYWLFVCVDFFSTDSTRVLIFFLLIWHLYPAFQLCGVDISTLLFKSANCRKLDFETSFDKYISRRHVGVHSCIYIRALQWYQLFVFFSITAWSRAGQPDPTPRERTTPQK